MKISSRSMYQSHILRWGSDRRYTLLITNKHLGGTWNCESGLDLQKCCDGKRRNPFNNPDKTQNFKVGEWAKRYPGVGKEIRGNRSKRREYMTELYPVRWRLPNMCLCVVTPFLKVDLSQIVYY